MNVLRSSYVDPTLVFLAYIEVKNDHRRDAREAGREADCDDVQSYAEYFQRVHTAVCLL
jgi:hypothetical protein